ncbi:unnamed protein product [Adineta ricciae]|uniref:LRAT domain-containing protein n=1 Tax=Adineta ricciae TaxID=249248 RepID=A0A813PK59_ADIRI|nr:unnamed protein product [Adineta ricciae]CAF1191222.1 unnamed protein product [Adineta ricciae]
MQLLCPILRVSNISLQPTNSHLVDIQSARTQLYPGAHIAAANPYEHFHHGIVVDLTSADISIIHFWGVKKREARIQVTTLPIFIAGNIKRVGIRTRQLYIVQYQNDTLEKQQETNQRAKSMLDKPDEYEYNIFRLNCESFAYFCRTERWESEQVTIMRNQLLNTIRNIRNKIKRRKKQCKNSCLLTNKTIPIGVPLSIGI